MDIEPATMRPPDNSAEASIESVSRFGTWISIEKRQPDHGQHCLIAHRLGVSEAEYLRDRNSEPLKPTWDAPYYGQDLIYSFDDVTHWMPMPSLPNTDNQGAPKPKRSIEDSWRAIRSGKAGLLGKKASKAYMTHRPQNK